MELSTLLRHVPHERTDWAGFEAVGSVGADNPDITIVRELDDRTQDEHALRWSNGRPPNRCYLGALIVPADFREYQNTYECVVIFCADPKASTIAAINALYGDHAEAFRDRKCDEDVRRIETID